MRYRRRDWFGVHVHAYFRLSVITDADRKRV